PFGAFSAGALLTGFSCYLLGHVVVWRRATGRWHLPRAGLAVAVLALWPVAAAVPPLLALGTAVAVLWALVAWEVFRAVSDQEPQHSTAVQQPYEPNPAEHDRVVPADLASHLTQPGYEFGQRLVERAAGDAERVGD